MTQRTGQLHLNAFLMSVGHHEAAWRLPESDPLANTDVEHFKHLARVAERGKLDSLFLADSPVLWNSVGRRPSGTLEPTVLLAALAGVTERVGLIATASTTYNEPYNLARRFASLDFLSGGRAGWNIVTTATVDAARNFNLDERAVRPGAAGFASVQNEYSLLVREPERGVLAESVAKGLGFLPYFPLASGLLSGKYLRGAPLPSGTRLSAADSPLAKRFLAERNQELAQRLDAFARERDHSLLELAFSWLLGRPAVACVIAGATSAAQVRANVAAARWQLTSAELEQVDLLAPAA